MIRVRYAIGSTVVVGAACMACARTQATVEPAPAPAAATTTAALDPAARFMQGMIAHHAQALEMAALVPRRSAHPGLRLLAERINVSQRDEIALMRRWLEKRGHTAPDSGAQADAGMDHETLMPGMLSPQQLARLAAADGVVFDRLFLELMIRHHEGALQMVAELLAANRNLDAETFRFVSDVDADQRAEIARMQSLLKSLS